MTNQTQPEKDSQHPSLVGALLDHCRHAEHLATPIPQKDELETYGYQLLKIDLITSVRKRGFKVKKVQDAVVKAVSTRTYRKMCDHG
jgi:hypothetical protein